MFHVHVLFFKIHLFCFMFRVSYFSFMFRVCFHVMCFIFILGWRRNTNMKPNNGGGRGQFFSLLLLVPLYTNTTTTRGTWPMHKRVWRSSKQGEERRWCALLIWKEGRQRSMMVGASVPCHSSLHNITMQEGTQTQQKKVWRTKNRTNNEGTKMKTISLVGGKHFSLHKHDNKKGSTDNA